MGGRALNALPAAVTDVTGDGRGLQRVSSGAPWEARVGYCRGVRAPGGLVFVGGTAPVAAGGGVHAPGDAYAQVRVRRRVRCWREQLCLACGAPLLDSLAE